MEIRGVNRLEEQQVRQLLRILGLVTGIGPLITAMRTSWDSFDAYGTVPSGESATLRLPAGPISIAFATGEKSSRGVEADLPAIAAVDGGEVPVEFMGALQGPSSQKSGYFADEQVRKRFATAVVPAEGDYVVRAAACTVLIGTAGFSRSPSPVAGRLETA